MCLHICIVFNVNSLHWAWWKILSVTTWHFQVCGDFCKTNVNWKHKLLKKPKYRIWVVLATHKKHFLFLTEHFVCLEINYKYAKKYQTVKHWPFNKSVKKNPPKKKKITKIQKSIAKKTHKSKQKYGSNCKEEEHS